MKQAFIGDSGTNSRLILIFAGWGMDDRVFSDISLTGHDVMVLWDYRDMDLDVSSLSRYAEVYVFAWSFGVFAASLKMRELGALPVMLRIAVNGSMTPVDDKTGIPEAIFQGTVSGLDERNLSKFYRRMCGSRSDYERFSQHIPSRGIGELKEELSSIYEASRDAEGIEAVWDRVIISDGDLIFPPGNLANAWRHLLRVRHIEGGHYPDFQKIMEQEIIDKGLVSLRFGKSSTTYDGAARVQREMASRLWALAHDHLPAVVSSLLEIGYGTGLLTSLYKDVMKDAEVTLWDLVPQPADFKATVVAGDAERLISDCEECRFDIILSASTVQWFNNLPRFISLASSKLKPGGVMAISTFGPENMKEITAMTRLPLRYYTLEELENMVPGYCIVKSLEEERRVIRFRSPREVMAHLSHTGVNALRRSTLGYSELSASYPREDGECPLTYHPQYIIIKRKENG